METLSVKECIRVNSRGLAAYRDEYIDDALWVPVEGPFKIPTAKKVVVVDKNAPAVIKTDHINIGDEVNIVSDNGRVVALGTPKQNI
ncbi:hypothetical protein [Pyrobaculum aerophilum]|uniref:hypothetical protein n=1 Tax=Pyrobaculum aerophilum TaxID=13773 RepID=UPI002161AC91|nr:hypothetical protein [Pyrobaculum aerophilum]